MSSRDREKWNAKYKNHMGESHPSELVKSHHSLAKKGDALDIACGNGRNSIFLAQQGFHVDAVDISDIAISTLKGRGESITPICMDLDGFDIQPNTYELIINIRFLDRRLFPMILAGLKPGGLLIFESFVHPDKIFCLRPGELRDAFSTLDLKVYEEKPLDPCEKFDQAVYLVGRKQ